MGRLRLHRQRSCAHPGDRDGPGSGRCLLSGFDRLPQCVVPCDEAGDLGAEVSRHGVRGNDLMLQLQAHSLGVLLRRSDLSLLVRRDSANDAADRQE
jgi:hypothetical protein